MKKNKRKNDLEIENLVLPQAETDLAGLVRKISEQLVALEKKVDTLINRAPESAPRGDRFGRPSSRFKRHDRSGGGKYDDRPREMSFTKAVCSQCGKECELPFKPTGDRPVYCRDCFSARKDSEPGSYKEKFGGERSRERSSGSGKRRGQFFQRRKGRS